MPGCRACGAVNPDEARFCQACGSPLEPPLPPREVRKTVTVVFCDVTGSTSLGERLDPETLRRVMGRYFEAMKAILEHHGATVEKFIGDAVMAVFGIPVAHEDDALRAVRAAAEMRDAVETISKDLERDLDVSLVARIGVNTGEVVAGDPSAGQALVTGDAVNVAARLEQAARPGEILIGADTHRLVRDAVVVEPVDPLSLKGKSRPTPAYRLDEVIPGAAGHTRRLDSPTVGRAGEAALLLQAFQRAVRDEACQLFSVLGPAGVGKSRLVNDFVGSAPEATVLRGRCLPYGEGITYFPVLDVVKQAAGLSDFDAPDTVEEKVCEVLQGEEHQELICGRLAQLLGVSEAAVPEETFWAIRRFLESVARSRPLIVVFDDVHWGEATFLDLVEHIADWSRDAAILLVCMARSDLLDVRPTWGGGKPNATTISLEPLSRDECDVLISNLLGAADVPPEVRDRIQAAAEGNPLFVEEMLAMLIDDGLLERDDGAWSAADLSDVSVPPTITALLTARIDRLAPAERAVLERASVVGKQFYLGAVRDLTPNEARADVPAGLMALVRKELIRPDRSTMPGEDAFRFRHLMIRDAAYDGMPKELRAELHGRFAGWLERLAGDRIAEQEEILGFHLAEAFRYRKELGPLDDRTASIGVRAAAHLAAAAERAMVRGDALAAVSLFERATGVLAPADPFRLGLMTSLAKALLEVGEIPRGMGILDEVAAAARDIGDRALEHRALLQAIWSAPRSMEESVGTAERAIAVFEELGDERGQALGWLKLGMTYFWLGRSATARGALERSLALAEASDEQAVAADALGWLPATYWNGETTTSRGIARCTEILERAGQDRRAMWLAQTVRGVLHARRGEFQEARADFDGAMAVLLEAGQRVIAAAHAMARGDIELLAGDPRAAAEVLEAGAAELERFGEAGFRSTVCAILATAYYELGRYEDAERIIGETERTATPDDLDPLIRVRSVRAMLGARAGDGEHAAALIVDALQMASSTDWLDIRGETLLDASEVHELLGNRPAARSAAEEALALFEATENLVSAARARERLARLR
jgi:class 3 adenylate cyclase/tetratricopeptide (TPR) repeat protein